MYPTKKEFRPRESIIEWTKDLCLSVDEAYELALDMAQLNMDEEEYTDIYSEYTTYLLEKELLNDDDDDDDDDDEDEEVS